MLLVETLDGNDGGFGGGGSSGKAGWEQRSQDEVQELI